MTYIRPAHSTPHVGRAMRNVALVMAVSAIVGIGLAVPAPAATPSNPFGSSVKRVPDSELAAMRGKFVRPEGISYFGVSLATSWQDSQGITTVARLLFNVDFLKLDSNGKAVTTLLVGWSRDGDSSMDVTGANEGYVAMPINAVGGLDTGAGAAQINVIAGANNSARNGMQVMLVPTSSLSDQDNSGLGALPTGNMVAFDDGDTIEFRTGENSIGLALSGNDGLDNSLQSIGGGAGRMLQQTVLNSDANRVSNTATIMLGADKLEGSGEALRMSEALNSMHGFGF